MINFFKGDKSVESNGEWEMLTQEEQEEIRGGQAGGVGSWQLLSYSPPSLPSRPDHTTSLSLSPSLRHSV